MKKLFALLCLTSILAIAADVEVVSPTDLTTKPAVSKTVKPEGFPKDRSALVAVEIIIDRTGSVIDAKVKKSTDADFEPSAIEAVRQWKFTPGKKGDQPVATRISVPFRFNAEQ